MKKIVLQSIAFFLLGLSSFTIMAQESVNTSGQNTTGTGGSVSYSVGQIVYTTNSGTNGSVAQGVQQPYEISVVLGIEHPEINLQMTVSPNPTTNSVTLKVANYEFETLSYQLYDITGKQFLIGQTSTNETQILLGDLPSSTYFLKITNQNTIIKTFKILKK